METKEKKKLKFNHNTKNLFGMLEGMEPDELMDQIRKVADGISRSDVDFLNNEPPEIITITGFVAGRGAAPDKITLRDALDYLNDALEVDDKFIALALAFIELLLSTGNEKISQVLEKISETPFISRETMFQIAFIYAYMNKTRIVKDEDRQNK